MWQSAGQISKLNNRQIARQIRMANRVESSVCAEIFGVFEMALNVSYIKKIIYTYKYNKDIIL